MIVQEVLKKTQDFFNKKQIPNSRTEAEVLLSSGLGWQRIQLYTKFDYPMSEAELTKCRSFVQRRLSGEPLAYIVGHQDFYNHNFLVKPGVLIPRPETEELVSLVIDHFKGQNRTQSKLKLADFGAGSGCIGVTLAYEFEEAQVDCFEFSNEALAVLEENIRKHQLEDRCQAIAIDLDQESPGTFLERGYWQYDTIVANPPYIAEDDPEVAEDVKNYEPHQALFAADEGLGKIKTWGQLALELLLPGGVFAAEMGWKQAPQVKEFFEGLKEVSKVEIKKDFSGHQRFALVTKSDTSKIA